MKSELQHLAELLGVVMKHDPITMAKVSAQYERRVEPRPDTRRAANDDA